MKYSYFYRKNKWNYALAIAFSILSTAIVIATAFYLEFLIDAAINGEGHRLKELVFFGVALVVLSFVVSFFRNHFKNRFLRIAMEQYKDEIFEKLFAKTSTLFRKQKESDYISAISNDLNVVEESYLSGSIALVNNIVLLVSTIGAMVYFNLIMTLVFLVMAVIPFLIAYFFGDIVVNAEKSVSERNSGFLAFLGDFLSGFSLVKTFQAENEVRGLFFKENRELEETKAEGRRKQWRVWIFSDLLGFMVTMVVLIVGVFLTVRGSITVGVVVAFLGLLASVEQPMAAISPLLSGRRAAAALVGKVMILAQDEPVSEIEGGQL